MIALDDTIYRKRAPPKDFANIFAMSYELKPVSLTKILHNITFHGTGQETIVRKIMYVFRKIRFSWARK